MDINQAITDNGCQEYGFKWSAETVSRDHGPNASDRRPVNNKAQIVVIFDVAKFEAAFPGYLLKCANGTSPRVECQRIGRKFTGNDIPGNRRAVVSHMMGSRVKLARIVSRPLPDGKTYTGTDETEYRQMYAAALVDAGVDGPLAVEIARRTAW